MTKQKYKSLQLQEMPYGTHFRDGRRKFIKVQDFLPSGLSIFNYTHIPPTEIAGKLIEKTECFQMVDLESGCTGRCPGHVPFDIIKLGECGPSVEERRKMIAEGTLPQPPEL